MFDPAIDAIIDAVKNQRRLALARGNVQVCQYYQRLETCAYLCIPKTLFLVGGFAASEYLFEKLKSRFEQDNLALYRPDVHAYVFARSELRI